MTDASTPDDEIISSYLDGEADSSAANQVESDANWMQRESELKAASALLAQPVTPLDPVVVDQMISAAIEAGGVPSNVTDLSAARRSRMPRILTAAAAVAMLALAVPIVRSIGDSSTGSDSAATSFSSAAAVDTSTAALDDGQAQAESAWAPAAAGARLDDAIDSSAFLGLPPVDPAMFDPLPARLPDVANMATLEGELTTRFASTPTIASDSQGQSSLSEPSEQIEISPQCADVLTEFAAGDAILGSVLPADSISDYALVSVNGTLDLVALIQIEPGRAMALVVDATECSSVTSINLTP